MRISPAVLIPFVTAVTWVTFAPPSAFGQGRGGAPVTAKAAAALDLTGYWVSIVSEDWRFRMVTPRKGDYQAVPLTDDGRKMADAWDPAADEAAGNQCKAYGAGAIMRVPGRLHITWQDDNTLKIETDAGTQTRLLRFGPSNSSGPAGIAQPKTASGEAPSWQGHSVARWDTGLTPLGGQLPLGLGPRQGTRSRSLEVVTTNLKPGYLRKNGVPYSDKTTVTEYFERFPKDRYQTEVESWRHLQSQNIEFTMKRLREPITP